ncbi:MAG: hypothetical protein RLO06_10525 [Parvibaculum sp.]
MAHRRSDRPPAHIWLARFETLAKIRDAGVPVRAFCDRCRNAFDIEVERLIAAYGPDFSLINRRGICRTHSCSGTCSFQVQPGRGLPFMPLLRGR